MTYVSSNDVQLTSLGTHVVSSFDGFDGDFAASLRLVERAAVHFGDSSRSETKRRSPVANVSHLLPGAETG